MGITDTSLFSRMKSLGSIQFASALLKSLSDSEAMPLVATGEDLLKQASRPSWETVFEILCALEAHESDMLFRLCVSEDDFARMKSLCQTRIQLERKAQQVLSPEAYVLWQEVGHLQGNTMRPVLARWIESCGCAHDADISSFVLRLSTWDAFIEAVRSVKQVSESKPSPSAEAWEEVLIHMRKRPKSVQPDWHGFGTCAFCWRMVPLEQATGQYRLVCHVHRRESAEYDSVRQLADGRGDDAIPGIRAEARRKAVILRAVFPVKACGFPDGWQELLSERPERLATSLEDCPQENRLDVVASYFPKVLAFVEGRSGDLHNAVSLLDTLDPASPAESESIRARRKTLHTILSRDLALWREELCTAEIWLTRYEEAFGRIK